MSKSTSKGPNQWTSPFSLTSKAFAQLDREQHLAWRYIGAQFRLSGINAFQKYNYDWWLATGGAQTEPPTIGQGQNWLVPKVEAAFYAGDFGEVVFSFTDTGAPPGAGILFSFRPSPNQHGLVQYQWNAYPVDGAFIIFQVGDPPDTSFSVWLRTLCPGYWRSEIIKLDIPLTPL
jgi:hypothetical protein